MPNPGYAPDERFLRRCALDALMGVGDKVRGQWEEWTGQAYHVRRRLSADEQRRVGDAVDIRGSKEAITRRDALGAYLRYVPLDMRDK